MQNPNPWETSEEGTKMKSEGGWKFAWIQSQWKGWSWQRKLKKEKGGKKGYRLRKMHFGTVWNKNLGTNSSGSVELWFLQRAENVSSSVPRWRKGVFKDEEQRRERAEEGGWMRLDKWGTMEHDCRPEQADYSKLLPTPPEQNHKRGSHTHRKR